MNDIPEPISDIPMFIKGSMIGVIEKIMIQPSTDKDNPWTKISFSGTLIKELKSSEQLVGLLQKEGIYLGKP